MIRSLRLYTRYVYQYSEIPMNLYAFRLGTGVNVFHQRNTDHQDRHFFFLCEEENQGFFTSIEIVPFLERCADDGRRSRLIARVIIPV
jgi:hypothetical protein